ncbi:MAG: alpha-amylase family glycosyl hydrolase [Pyrobaculum sp.]
MGCVVEKWRQDPYYGYVAVVKTGGEAVGDFSGWVKGAFQDVVELPPGVYKLASGEECVVEPFTYPWHLPVPYMAADWGGVAELRIYAPEEPEVVKGTVYKLADVGPFSIYLATTASSRYEVRCCGKRVRGAAAVPAGEPPAVAMYEVLPDRASNRLGCRNLKADFCGGTLKDVAELAYWASAFSDFLYLHPIYPAMSYHRYDVVDHFQVDERLGGWQAFYALKSRLSELKMGLVLDVVLYHVGLRSSMFPAGPFLLRDPAAARLAKALADAYPQRHLRELLQGEPPYDTFLKVWLMPRIDYTRPEAVEYAKKVVEFWAARAEGLRLDVSHGIPPGVWKEALAPASGRYVFGEHVGNPASFFSVIRGFTAYLLYGAFLKWGEGAQQVAKAINTYIALTPPTSMAYMNTFLDNHDVDRAAARLKLADELAGAYAVLFALPGVPSIYAGSECGVEGLASDHSNRTPFNPCKHKLVEWFKKLYKVRRSWKLGRGPVYAEARRGVLKIRRWGTEVEVKRGTVVFSNTYNVVELFF